MKAIVIRSYGGPDVMKLDDVDCQRRALERLLLTSPFLA